MKIPALTSLTSKIRFLLLFLAFFYHFTNHGQIIDTTQSYQHAEDIVVSASKQPESILQSPVSIETLDTSAIKTSAQPTFFDALENVKGLQLIQPSLGFKVINARGFTNTTNVRFVQMVDGMDIQAPHIGAPIANSMGPSDLDILQVEVIPGSASAMYGMNAINGLANFITKDPFTYQGLSISQKVGVNHVNDNLSKATPYYETSLRYAQALSNRFAFKVNGTFMQGTDWYANNYTDLNPTANSTTGLPADNNPGKDYVNVYGDESSNRKTLTLGGKQYVVSRTGYPEYDLTSYKLQNVKTDATLVYKIRNNLSISYTYRFAFINTTYQRTNRFRLEDYITQQQALSLSSNSIQFKTYFTSENTGQSYNIRSMGENLDRYYKSNDNWFNDYKTGYNNGVTNGLSTPDALDYARTFADQGRPHPGTPEADAIMKSLGEINNWDKGAALRVRDYMYHAEFQHNLTQVLLKSWKSKYKVDLMYGGDFREYIIIPDGNYFINPTDTTKNLTYKRFGGFVQATKYLMKEKIKINGVLRVDKNDYYSPKLNPRIAVVYAPNKQHSVRISAQSGYRFPSLFEGFSNVNSGGVKRVGGFPVMSNGIFENSYLRTSIDAFNKAVTADVNTGGMTKADAITKEQHLLKQNPYTYLQPEHVTSFELGYRSRLFKNLVDLNMDTYFNNYKNLIAQVEAYIPKGNSPDSVAYYLNNTATQDRYRLWTNSQTVSYNVGGTAGLYFNLPKDFKVGGNVTLAKLYRKTSQDGLEDGFNTPTWMYNLSIQNPRIYKTIGAGINYRRQNGYLWQSSLATGHVAGYYTLDTSVQCDLVKEKLNVKIGGTNILNMYYYSFIGGPSIGAFYYVNVLFKI